MTNSPEEDIDYQAFERDKAAGRFNSENPDWLALYQLGELIGVFAFYHEAENSPELIPYEDALIQPLTEGIKPQKRL